MNSNITTLVIWFFFSLPIYLFTSCDKEQVDPFEHCGEPREGCNNCDWNAFKCKIDGEDWCANCKSDNILFGCDPVDCLFYLSDTSNWISLVAFGGKYSFGVVGTAKKLNEKSVNARDMPFKYDPLKETCYEYSQIGASENYFVISEIDKENNIVGGAFEMNVVNECGDTTRITDGYFKVTYRS